MRIEGDWADLKTRGFVVVREFLDAQAVSRVLDPYLASQEDPHEFGFCPAHWLGDAGKEVVAELDRRIRDVLPDIRDRANLNLSTFDPFTAYFPNGPGGTGWHSDPPPYYLFRDLSRYVNCWIPLLKPSRTENGMSVVPMDVLAEREPEAHEAIYGRGGTSFAKSDWVDQGTPNPEELFGALGNPGPDDRLVIQRDGKLTNLQLKVDINEIAVTPDVGPGDAVFVRGDVLHKTQDGQVDANGRAKRIAISMRIADGDMELPKAFLLGLPELYRKHLAFPRSHIAPALFGAFAYHRRDVLSTREIVDFILDVRAQRPDQVAATTEVAPNLMSVLGVTSYANIP